MGHWLLFAERCMSDSRFFAYILVRLFFGNVSVAESWEGTTGSDAIF